MHSHSSSPTWQQTVGKLRSPHWFSLGLVLALSSLLFFSPLVRSQQPVTITVLLQALEIPQWQPLVDKFEAENPDIHLEMVEGPNATNLVEDLYTSSFLLGSSPYDVVYMDIVWVPKFAAAGWLMDLSDRVTEADLRDFMEADVEGGRYQDKLYRMPLRSDAGMLYYRTDLLKELGRQPPETFAELVEASQLAQERGLADWGYLWQGKQYEGLAAMFVEVLEGFGADWVNPETLEVGLDQPAAVEATEFLISTLRDRISPPGVTTYQEDEVRRLFQSGGALFMRNWPYAWSLGNAEGSQVRGQFGIKPMVHTTGATSGACLGGWGLGIAQSSPHPDEAWRLIEFFSRADVQREFILLNSYVPSRRSLFTDTQIVAKFPHYPELLKVVESAVLRPPIAQYAQASDILQRYLSAAITGRMTAEDAMQVAAGETRRLLSRI